MLFYDSRLYLLKKRHYTPNTAGSISSHHISKESWVLSKLCKISVQLCISYVPHFSLHFSIVVLQSWVSAQNMFFIFILKYHHKM